MRRSGHNSVGDVVTTTAALSDLCAIHGGVSAYDGNGPYGVVTCGDGMKCGGPSLVCANASDPAASACESDPCMIWDDAALSCIPDTTKDLGACATACNAGQGTYWDPVHGCLAIVQCSVGGCFGTVQNGVCVKEDPTCAEIVDQSGKADCEIRGNIWNTKTGVCTKKERAKGGTLPGFTPLPVFHVLTEEEKCKKGKGTWHPGRAGDPVAGHCSPAPPKAPELTQDEIDALKCKKDGGTYAKGVCTPAAAPSNTGLYVAGGLGVLGLLWLLMKNKSDSKGKRR